MALVKCKECGEEVSNKAKTCPKCGAKAPKKTSAFTWLVLIFIIFIIYSVSQTPTTPVHSVSSSSSPKPLVTRKASPVKPAWTTSTSKDKMTGKVSAYASSPIAFPSKKMGFPYANVNAWLGVGCNKKDEWVYIGFNNSPNLANTQTKDGYNLIQTRIKWDDTIKKTTLTQEWQSSFIHFRNGNSAISNIVNSKTALLELQWHGEQGTYFEFSLNGSSAALKKIRAKCSQ